MPIDLADVKEIREMRSGTHSEHTINEKLASGIWKILEAKIVKKQDWVASEKNDGFLKKDSEIIYILGRTKDEKMNPDGYV